MIRHKIRAAALTALIACLLVAGPFAWPVGLSGLRGNSLAANDRPGAACDADGVLVTYDVTFDAGVRDFVVDTITLSGIDVAGCQGRRVTAVVLDRTLGVLDQTSGLDVVGASAVQTLGLATGGVLARTIGSVHATMYAG